MKNENIINTLFLILPKFQNNVKQEIQKFYGDSDEKTKEVKLNYDKLVDFQTRLFNEFKYNCDSLQKDSENQVNLAYEQPMQFFHLVSSKYLSCQQKEAKFENQNFMVSLDKYPSDNTLFKISPAFKYQNDGD